MVEEIITYLGLALGTLALAAAFQCRVAQLIRIKGRSMENTLKNGDVVLVVKGCRGYRRGDVVICRYPNRVQRTFSLGAAFTLTWHTLFVKRLAALPGDKVEIQEGKLLVNSQRVADPPQMGSAPPDMPERTLYHNQYFVLGDNRGCSHDSRAVDVGPLKKEALLGKVAFILWPMGRMGRVR